MVTGRFAAALLAGVAMLGWAETSHAVTQEELLEIIQRQSEEIEKLKQRVDSMENGAKDPAPQYNLRQAEEIEQLKKRVDNVEKAAEDVDTKVEDVKKAAQASNDSGVEFKLGPAPTIRSKDGRFEFKVRGRLLTDYNYVQSDDEPQRQGGERIDTSSTEFRAARLGVEGRAWKDVKYKLEADFADNDVDLKDAHIDYVGDVIKPVKYVRIGQYKTPNSLEEQTSSRFTTFMERAAFTDAFDLDRRIGLGLGFGGDDWTFDFGGFSQNNDDADSGLNEGYAIASRGTYAFRDVIGNDLIHLGGSIRYRDLDNQSDDNEARYRQRPFFHDTNRSIDTGTINDADSDILGGIEAAYVNGPFSVQGEAAHTWLEIDGANNQNNLWGGYIDLSYFLTGEERAYKGGKFNRVKVKDPVFDGGWGAWQLGTRLDFIDLNDDVGEDGAQGGQQYSLIAGLNWHLNNHTRLMLNYAYTRVFDGEDANGNQIEGDTNDIHGVGLRAQIDF